MQITRTTPLRLMILQFRQIFLTDASTFMASFLVVAYFARKTMRAFERSYGVSSTVTLSPGRILM